MPADLKARILTTNITLDEGACSLDVLEEAAGYFGLGLAQAQAMGIIKAVAMATREWRAVATAVGARPAEIRRMASAFEHEEHAQALAW